MSKLRILSLTNVLLLSTSAYNISQAHNSFGDLIPESQDTLPKVKMMSSYANSLAHMDAHYTPAHISLSGIQIEEDALSKSVTFTPAASTSLPQKLEANVVVDFAQLSYSVYRLANLDTFSDLNQQKSDKELLDRIVNDGWDVVPFNGTTGTAQQQNETVSGLVAFKGNQVVIATRGTVTKDDWYTNLRPSRNLFGKFFSKNTKNKLGWITANFMYGMEGEIANGFLQTHLSSRDQIKKIILAYTKANNFLPKDLQYTVTGHSLGGAKAILNGLDLLTDTELGIGVDILNKSFIGTVDTDLAMSGFYGISEKTQPKNKGNVDIVLLEAPRAFAEEAALKAKDIIGNHNVIRVENYGKGRFDADLVPHVSPEFLGYKHIGIVAPIDQGANFLDRHFMNNVVPQAPFAIDKARQEIKADVANIKVIEADIKSPFVALLASASVQPSTPGFFGRIWNKINPWGK